VLVFARAPEPGRVKTRLIPALGPEGAAALHEKLTLHALSVAKASGVGPVRMWCAPDAAHPFFLECRRRFALTLHAQGRGDLGERMARAFRTTLAQAWGALLIGSDIPAISADYLRDAQLQLREADAVLGPAEDGGYVLIGLRRHAPALFRAMPWGEPSVLAQTRRRLSALGLRRRELAPLRDVDRPEDLGRLPARFTPGAL
jgi:rSAM/selenodomain-associated transferase 1